MKSALWILLIVGFNLLIAYIISLYSFVMAVGWFCLAIGFQFGKWYGGIEKENKISDRNTS
jgi:hypothetical protein